MPIIETASRILTPFGSVGDIRNSTGGTVRTVGNFRYHVYSTTGTFTFNATGLANVNALVVGGGGNGGTNIAGGGGAGGVINYQSVVVQPGTYSVVVGAGGTGGSDWRSVGAVNGQNSSFQHAQGTLTAFGGGNGDSGSGGSGGGANHGGGSNVGLGTSGQGNNGGSAIPYANPYYAGGGGGGFSAAGGNAVNNGGSNTTAGSGGQGLTLDANTASLPEFSGMTVISSGGGGCFLRNTTSGTNNRGLGGTGAGDGGGSQGSNMLFLPTAATSFGSGAGGVLWEAVGNANSAYFVAPAGMRGVVVIRYPI
jgi:hypothetical protein